MTCHSEVLHLVAVAAGTVRVSGRVDLSQQRCPVLQVLILFPDAVREGEALFDGEDWSCDVQVSPKSLEDWCDHARYPGPFTIVLRCVEDGHVACEQQTQATLVCCPVFHDLGFTAGDCVDTDDGTFRPLTWTLALDWPPGYEPELTLEFAVWRTTNPALRSSDSFAASLAAGSLYAVTLLLRADRHYDGSIACISPQLCADAVRPLARFHVPACDCVLPPPPASFFTVRDERGQVVAAPDAGCVASAFVTIQAQVAVAWSASTAYAPVDLAVIDATTVRLDLPADGTRVVVTAVVSLGDCVHPVSMSVTRCLEPEPPCTPVPDSYALQVFDTAGAEIAAGACLRGAVARVVAPPHEGPVEWRVGDAAAQADPATPRELRVPLPAQGTLRVSATVGRAECAAPFERELVRCAEGTDVSAPAQVDRFWPRISWCMILLVVALVLLLGGTLLFTVGCGVMIVLPCFVEVAGAAATPTGGLSILAAIVVYAFFVEVAIFGAFCMVAGLVLLLLWLYFCGGCDGVSVPLSFCEMLRWCQFVLLVVGSIVFVIELVISVAVVVLDAICGTVAASLLQLIPLAIDLGVLGLANLLVYVVGNAIGCFHSWPRGLPLPRLPNPSSLNLPCLDRINP